MKKFFNLILGLMLLAPVGAFAQGLNTYTTTTLTNAVDASAKLLVFGSNTNMAPAANNNITVTVTNNVKQLVLIDAELVEVQGTTGSTLATVSRGAYGTQATRHAAGVRVWVGPPEWFPVRDFLGACTEAIEPILPVFSINRNSKQVRLYNCVGGTWRSQWVPSDYSQGSLEKACTVPIGSVAYGSFGTDTTLDAYDRYVAEVTVPQTMFVTGITVLSGGTASASAKKVYYLYSMSGNLIANTAIAGTTSSTSTDSFQAIAFTAPVLVTGPAHYLIVVVDDEGATDKIRTVAASTFNGLVASLVEESSDSFAASAVTFVVPTTFTADVGPIGCLY